MPYILVYKMKDLTYYVQNYGGRGIYFLNGLINNAEQFKSEQEAITRRPELEKRVGKRLEVIPTPFRHR